jgi:hypothetical protein
MTQIDMPQFQVEDARRAKECQIVCTKAFAKLVDEAVALGWRREEVAVQLADAADDYVLYLASNSTNRKAKSANDDDGSGPTEQAASDGTLKATISSRGVFLRVK